MQHNKNEYAFEQMIMMLLLMMIIIMIGMMIISDIFVTSIMKYVPCSQIATKCGKYKHWHSTKASMFNIRSADNYFSVNTLASA